MGTALNLARNNGATVEVLVEGHWLSGRVASIDSHGVVLTNDGMGHSIIRVDKITAVNLKAADTGRHAPSENAREASEVRVASIAP
jgi:sRNA-binding regulator protein Hfq